MNYLLCSLLLTTALLPIVLRAGLPLPDHVLYGTIAIDQSTVTRVNGDVVIEARRSTSSPVVAAYRMGTAARLGEHFYELRLMLEDTNPSAPRILQPGEEVLLTVRDRAGVRFEARHRIPAAGDILRLDFGASVDTDGDGVPDGWERARLGTTASDLDRDTDGDGVADRDEYFGGTGPTDRDDVFRLAVVEETGAAKVSFRALRSLGTGFEGRTRFYALESSTNLVSGPWSSITNLSRILGQDQLVEYEEPSSGPSAPNFFRVRVWLEGP